MQSDYQQWAEHSRKCRWPTMTQDRVDVMFQATRIHGPSSCWTGTAGSLAAMIVELLRERESLLAKIEGFEIQAKDDMR